VEPVLRANITNHVNRATNDLDTAVLAKGYAATNALNTWLGTSVITNLHARTSRCGRSSDHPADRHAQRHRHVRDERRRELTANGFFINSNVPPAAATSIGQQFLWNSNGTALYVLISAYNSTAWSSTNALAP